MSIAESKRVSETTRERQQADAAIGEAAAVAILHALNGEYVRAVAESDTAWYEANLCDDFVCTLADGHRINRTEFLQRAREGSSVRDVRWDEVDVHVLGEVALVFGVMHFLRSGMLVLNRYTTVWQTLDGCWLAVATQLTEVSRS